MLDERFDKLLADSIHTRHAHIGDLSQKDRTAFIDDAIQIFGAKGRAYALEAASRVIATALCDDRLRPEHQSMLATMTYNRSELCDMLEKRIDEVKENLFIDRVTHLTDLIATDSLDSQQQSSHIEKAINLLGREPYSDTLIAEALARVRVPADLQSIFQSKIDKDEYLYELIHFYNDIGDISPAPSKKIRRETSPEGGDTRSIVKKLRERFEKISNDTTISEHQRVEEVASVAHSLRKKVESVQVNPARPMRVRERSGYGL